jgi:hypothetical protein
MQDINEDNLNIYINNKEDFLEDKLSIYLNKKRVNKKVYKSY